MHNLWTAMLRHVSTVLGERTVSRVLLFAGASTVAGCIEFGEQLPALPSLDADGQSAADEDAACALNSFCSLSTTACETHDDPIAVAIAAPGESVRVLGRLDEDRPTWSRLDENCGPSMTGEHAFGQHRLHNATGQSQLVNVRAMWRDDGFLHAFVPCFDSVEPTACITGNDDAESRLKSGFRLILTADEAVDLVASTFDPMVSIGDYSIDIETSLDLRVVAPPGEHIILSGALGGTDPLWARPIGCRAPDDDLDHPYDVYQLLNAGETAVSVTADAEWVDEVGALHWFHGVLPLEPVSMDRCGGSDTTGGEWGTISGIPIDPFNSILLVVSSVGGGVEIPSYVVRVTTE